MANATTKRVRLGEVVSEYSARNRDGVEQSVYSVTNSNGFVCSTDYFSKAVYSKDLTTYKCVEHGMFAYNPSRINVGSVACWRGKGVAIVSPLYVVFKIDEARVDSRLLEMFFHSTVALRQIQGLTSGSVRDSLKYSALCKIEIPLPPLAEQKRIAEVLDKISAMKRNAEARVQKLDLLVKSRFVEMFGDNYPVVSVGDVYHVGGPKRIMQSEWVSDGVPFLKISDLMNRVDGKTAAASSFISAARFNELKSQGQVPKAGDVLITARGTLGRCYVVRPDDEFYFQDGMITWLSERSSKLDLTYFLAAVQSAEFRKQYQGVSPGSTVAYLSISQLSKLKLPLPPLALQREFAAFVEKVEKLKATAQRECEQVDLLYRAKLQEYFG